MRLLRLTTRTRGELPPSRAVLHHHHHHLPQTRPFSRGCSTAARLPLLARGEAPFELGWDEVDSGDGDEENFAISALTPPALGLGVLPTSVTHAPMSFASAAAAARKKRRRPLRRHSS